MSFITTWLTFCSDCFNHRNSSLNQSSQSTEYSNVAKYCLHISNKRDSICYKCFLNFFGYDRFIIRHLFSYLSEQQKDYINIKQFDLFAERILNWHEFFNHIDFILQLFHIILNMNFNEYFDSLENNVIDPILFYELIKDAFFFTTIQANVQINLTNQSEIFLQNFCNYFHVLNQNHTGKNYFTLVKRIIPWGLISIHRWLKNCLLSPTYKIQITSDISNEFNSDLSYTFLWYITNWLVSNKVFPNDYDPIIIFGKLSRQELITDVYDSDKHGHSIVILCECTYDINGPFLMIFYCNDERIFAFLLDGKLMDSAKPYGGRASLCLQLSPQFIILERGPSMFYWNIKTRSDGPLGIHIGHNGLIRLSLSLDLEHIHHPEGSSSINRIQIYKFGVSQTSITNPILQRHTSLIHKQV